VIGRHFPIGNGATMAAAPPTVLPLRELVAGVGPDMLRERSVSILREIDRSAPSEPGEDDE